MIEAPAVAGSTTPSIDAQVAKARGGKIERTGGLGGLVEVVLLNGIPPVASEKELALERKMSATPSREIAWLRVCLPPIPFPRANPLSITSESKTTFLAARIRETECPFHV